MEGPQAKYQLRLDRLPDEIFLTVLQFCHKDDIESTFAYQSKEVRKCTMTTCIRQAVRNQNIENMNWIKERSSNKLCLNANTFTAAAIHGNIEIIVWLKSHGCPWNEYTLLAAADCCNFGIGMVDWLKNKKIRFR